MKKRIARIARILENLINDYQVNSYEFMNEFNVSESTLQRDFNKVIQYLSYESARDDYSINMDVELKNFINLSDIQLIAIKIAYNNDPINQNYLENLFSPMNKLPKRRDLKYKQIEKFKDYEMTYCIVHEMAIRNKIVIKLVRDFHKFVSFRDKKNNMLSTMNLRLKNNQDSNGDLQRLYDKRFELYNKCSRRKTIEYLFNILQNVYMISPLDCKIDGIDYVPGQKYTTLHRDYYTSSQIQSMIDDHVRLNTNQFNHVGNVKLDSSNLYGHKNYDGFNLEQLKYDNENENDFEYSIISPSFSRSIVDNNITTLSINFSLPKEEILAYITHLKDTLYPKQKEKKIKTPEEMDRGEIYSSNFTKLKTVDMADYFFIYDYVTKRKDKLVENYIKEKKENEEQNGYPEDVDKELVHSIFKDEFLEKQTKLDIPTITRYYYTMYHYIDKLEYRELVNSAFYKPKNQDGRLLSTGEQQQNRNQMIKYFEKNFSCKEIANRTGVSLSRVYALKKQYDERDEKLLIAKRGKKVGDKKISDELDKQIIQHLLQDGNKIWDKESTRTMIEQDLNTKLSISSVDNYLKTKQIRFDNCTEFLDETISIKQWIEYGFSQMISEAKKKNAIICWTDSYNRQEIQNNIYLTRLIIYPNSKFMFNLSRSNNSIDSLIEYLTILITQLNKMIFLIVDYFIIEHLNINDKEKIETFLQKNTKKIKLCNKNQ